jgi:hypothetical protein
VIKRELIITLSEDACVNVCVKNVHFILFIDIFIYLFIYSFIHFFIAFFLSFFIFILFFFFNVVSVQGMVDAGEVVSQTIKREFGEETLNMLEASEAQKKEIEKHINQLFQHGTEVIISRVVQQ